MDIYVLNDGKEIGPLSVEKARLLMAQGSVAPEALAWTPGMEKWLPLAGLLPPGDEPTSPPTREIPESAESAAVAPVEEAAPAPVATLAPAAASLPFETSTPKQRALLAFLHIPFTLSTSKSEAALLISEALENSAYAVRIGQWPSERLKLHGDLFTAELQARRENRAHHYLTVVQTEGAALFSGITRNHVQSAITHLDLERTDWETHEATAARTHLFPALAEKFPQLVLPEAQRQFARSEANKHAHTRSSAGAGSEPSRRGGVSIPWATMARVIFFAALLGGMAWFGLRLFHASPTTSSTATEPAEPAAPTAAPAPVKPAEPMANTPAVDPPAPATPAPIADAPPAPAPLPEAPAPPPAPPPMAPSASLRLVKAFDAPLQYGAMKLASGTELQFVAVEGALLKVQYRGNTFLVPSSFTNRPLPAPSM